MGEKNLNAEDVAAALRECGFDDAEAQDSTVSGTLDGFAIEARKTASWTWHFRLTGRGDAEFNASTRYGIVSAVTAALQVSRRPKRGA